MLLLQCLQGPGSFRRFKAALSGRPEQLSRWRVFRLERIRTSIVDWFDARSLIPASFEHAWPGDGAVPMRSDTVESARERLQPAASALAPGDLHALTSLAEFLRATRSGLPGPEPRARRRCTAAAEQPLDQRASRADRLATSPESTGKSSI